MLRSWMIRKGPRVAAVVLLAAGATLVGAAVALAAPNPCNSVFNGATPRDPIVKTADPATATPGSQVTYTIQWLSTGAGLTNISDCFRVDDGGDDTLNVLVSVFSVIDAVHVNVGDAGTLQTFSFTITIPNDPALIGHAIVNRAKSTHGSTESRSALVSVSIVAPPEVCGDGVDNNLDGQVDEGCGTPPPPPPPAPTPEPEDCDDTVDNDLDGLTDAADPDCQQAPPPPPAPTPEVCDDTVDNDLDGLTDAADPDCQQAPPPPPPAPTPEPEVCDDTVDNDLDGLTDAADPDCQQAPPPPAPPAPQPEPEDCDDTVDNDLDGLTDAADPDCQQAPPPPAPPAPDPDPAPPTGGTSTAGTQTQVDTTTNTGADDTPEANPAPVATAGGTDTVVLGTKVSAAPLAQTGNDTRTIAGIGAAFLMAGMIMRLAPRRRRMVLSLNGAAVAGPAQFAELDLLEAASWRLNWEF